MATTSPAAPPGTERPAAVQWGKVGALVSGQAAVQAGSFALLIAMNWTAVQIGGTGALTLVLLAATVPRALMLVFGGAVADLLGPRVVLLRATSARVAVLVAGALVVAGTDRLWPLALVAVVEGALLGLAGPASGVLMPHLATREHLARANSLYGMVLRVAPIAGAPLGAWLITVGHLWVALAAAAAGCAVWLGCAAYVTHGFARPRREPGVSLLRRSGDGFRLLAAHPRLRWMFLASFCIDLAFSWPAEVALPLLVSQRGWGVGAVGVVLACFGAGALGSSALGAALAHRIPVFVRLVATGAGLAAGIAVMALMPSVVTLAAVAGAVGLLSGLNGPAIVTVYQQAVPEGRMGAAMSTLSLAGIGTAPVSIAVFSTVSLGLGVRQTWLLCGAIACLSPLFALYALRSPAPEAAEGTTGAPSPEAGATAGSPAAVPATTGEGPAPRAAAAGSAAPAGSADGTADGTGRSVPAAPAADTPAAPLTANSPAPV
ncbi:MFS transporter [Streptomyces bambusae]|uniref:MFS transporter n=1 Tax=Streptomyces bambusae TaxID=1550616 RepID=UPI001CFEC0A4|nr:MFS transporter [Streptomyces bambusae]MCB5163545.1 MFS transporter [Streptomyces bambusae]